MLRWVKEPFSHTLRVKINRHEYAITNEFICLKDINLGLKTKCHIIVLCCGDSATWAHTLYVHRM